MWLPFAVIGAFVLSGDCATPSSGEFSTAQSNWERWFGDQPEACYLEVVSEDVHDGIGRGISWRGTPYQIAEKTYAHGLAFNSTKRIRIHMSQPAVRFTAEVGLENNDNTRGGTGSVTFHVFAQDKELFSTPVMHLKEAARKVEIALPNVNEFDVEVGDGGDGRGWDQGLWAEAVIELADGRQVRLQDIPEKNALDYNPIGFSFNYGDKASSEFIGQWNRGVSALSEKEGWIERTITFEDPATNLSISFQARRFRDFPAFEWLMKLKNNGDKDTPILDTILPMDFWINVPSADQPTLHWAKGGVASFDDFAPVDEKITEKAIHLQPGGGRSSNAVLPFFNVEGSTGGVVAGIGWSGEWEMDFAAKSGGVVMKGGLAKTHLLLHPGEEIRMPRYLVLFYEGDQWHGQNLFRQLILAHYRPAVNGKPLMAPITNGNWGGTSAEIHLDNIKKITERDLPLDYYWIDAEWYGAQGGPGTWAINVGNWDYKQEQYPNGFRPLSDALRKSGRELMLWFEPERVFKGTKWWNEHPDWLLKDGGENALFNLGNPEACKFLTDFISDRIDEFGLGCYRQDFNIDPLRFWTAADTPDRVGMSEIRYIEGLYAYWDGLLSRHPNLIIDNCASGGRRIDLETTMRSTPFWRTDGPRDPIAHQCHTFGLLRWIPFSATSQDRAGDDYEFRSSMCSSLCLNWWVSGDKPAEIIPDSFPMDWAKKTLDQYRQFNKYYYGDYYPLTPYSQAKTDWMAYQLDLPAEGSGLVVVLKRPAGIFLTAALPLQAIDPAADYTVTDLSTGAQTVQNGKALAQDGLIVTLKNRPDSALLEYKKK